MRMGPSSLIHGNGTRVV